MSRSRPVWNCRGAGALLLAAFVAAGAVGDEFVQVTCPVVADTTLFSASTGPSFASCGAGEHLQTRGTESLVLLRFDLEAVAGLEITQATLRVRRVRDLLTRVGVSTVATTADWVEGRATEPTPEEGSVCYSFAAYRGDRRLAQPWALPGSDFSDVVFGNGGSRWVTRVAEFDKESLWYEIDVPPEFVQAMVAGWQSDGLCLSDDFGRRETAPTFWSRESKDKPELIVRGRRVSPRESEPPRGMRAYRDTLGREWLEFSAPQALGFGIHLCSERPEGEADLARGTKLETWALPTPGPGVRRVLLSLHRAATHRYVAVRVMEMGGRWSAVAASELPAVVRQNPVFSAPELKHYDLPDRIEGPFTLDGGPALSEDGRWMHSAGQTWWDPHRGPIALQAGRNEFVAFQVMLAGGPGTYAVTLAAWESPGAADPAPRVQIYRQHYVKSRLGHEKFAPDALVEIEPGEPLRLDLLTPEQAAAPRTQPARRKVVQGIWVDVYVPHKAARGVWRSRVIVVRDGRALLDVPLELEVVRPALPDVLGFAVSLDSDRLPARVFNVAGDSPEAWDLLDAYYRMAHAHRVTVVLNPYRPDGRVQAGFAPPIEFEDDAAVRLDWDEWDRRFGRYLDGSAFRDLPREAVPLDHFRLPFHENWPMRFVFKRASRRSHLSGKYHYRSTWTERRPGGSSPHPDQYMVWPIEDAFAAEYREGTAAVLGQFARHLVERGWSQTEFLLALTNRCGARDTGSWWFLSEPQVIDDVRALAFWLGMYRAVLADVGPNPVRLRADLAWPQSQRDLLDGLVDISVLDETFLAKNQLVLAHPERYPTVWFAYPRLAPESGWSEVFRLGWAARLAGAHGVVCRQALGDDESWEQAEDAALLYPGGRFGRWGPYASLRLKALRRLQQDQDWLERWMDSVRKAGTPEGYALSTVAATLVTRSQGRLPRRVALLPIAEFPGRLDTVAFEEIRRGLRQVLAE